MSPIPKRHLVITADDFGFSTERNLGIKMAATQGGVVSTSLLLNCTGTEEGVAMAKAEGWCCGQYFLALMIISRTHTHLYFHRHIINMNILY